MLKSTLVFLFLSFISLILGKSNTAWISENNAVGLAVVLFFLSVISLLMLLANDKAKRLKSPRSFKAVRKAHLKQR